MPAFDPRDLRRIDGADEVDLETHKRDGSLRRTIVWIAVADDRVYVRSIKGDRGVWYRELRVDTQAALGVDGDRLPVRATQVTDADEIARVTEAFRRKYSHSQWVTGVVKPESWSGTLRLDPR